MKKGKKHITTKVTKEHKNNKHLTTQLKNTIDLTLRVFFHFFHLQINVG
jgi:hypothetical protein